MFRAHFVKTMLGGEDEHIIRGGFEVEFQRREAAVEVIHGNEGADGDAETGGGGDESLADTTRDFFDGQFAATDAGKAAHDASDGAKQTEQRCECDDGIHGSEEAAGATQFLAGGDFEGTLHAGFPVMQTMVDHAHDRIGGVLGFSDGFGEITSFERLINAIELLRVTLGGEAQPPEDALDEHAKRKRGDDQDRIHDRAAFVDEFDDDVGDWHGENCLAKTEGKRQGVALAGAGRGEAPVSAHPVGGIAIERRKAGAADNAGSFNGSRGTDA